MNPEPCSGCGRIILVHRLGGLTVRCDPTPLDAQQVAALVVGGGRPWTPVFGPGLIPRELRPARPGDAKLLKEHRCTAAEALSRPAPVLGGPAAPKGRETGAQRFPADPSTPSSDRPAPTGPSSATAAALPRSDGPACSECGEPCSDGTYASIELGDLVLWARHVTDC